MEKQMGYNILLDVDGKKLLGTTQHDFSNTPNVKESITKDDKGNTNATVVGHNFTFTVAGLMYKKSEDEVEVLDSDDIFELATKIGQSAEIPFIYRRSTLKSYSGKAIISGYSEASPAEDEGTYSLNLRVIGTLELVENE